MINGIEPLSSAISVTYRAASDSKFSVKRRIAHCKTFLYSFCIACLGAPLFAQGPYYPVYTNPPAANQPASTQPAANPPAGNTPANTQPAAPAPAYYPAPTGYYVTPYYEPPYYGPVTGQSAYHGPYDPALGPWKFNFNFGGGPTAVTDSHDKYKTGGNFTVGGGYNFNQRLGIALEFMQTDLGLTDNALNQNNAFDGDSWLWAVTVEPTWRYKIGGIVGGYLIGGGGFYEREDKFDQTVVVPTFFGQRPIHVVDRQTDDTGGLNAGAGFTFNVGWGTKFYVEARYHYIFTAGRATQIIPVTFGFRW